MPPTNFFCRELVVGRFSGKYWECWYRVF